MHYYSKTTLGFYNKEINGENMPVDVVEVQDQDYVALMKGQSAGKIIVPNEAGFPILSDMPPPTPEELKEKCKSTAKRKLEDTDYSQAEDVRKILINVAEFDAYRSVVRGLFFNPVPNPTWPAEPVATWSAP